MLEFTVNGMTCGGCARAVTNAIKAVDDTATIQIDLPSKRVAVESAADPARVRLAIEAAGYVVELLAA